MTIIAYGSRLHNRIIHTEEIAAYRIGRSEQRLTIIYISQNNICEVQKTYLLTGETQNHLYLTEQHL